MSKLSPVANIDHKQQQNIDHKTITTSTYLANDRSEVGGKRENISEFPPPPPPVCFGENKNQDQYQPKSSKYIQESNKVSKISLPTVVHTHKVPNFAPKSQKLPEITEQMAQNNKIPVYGPGISNAIVNTTAEFFIDVSKAGTGQIGIGMMGPSDAAIQMKSLPNNKCKVNYTPVQAGTYKVTIKFANQEIEGSPFSVKVLNEDGSEGTDLSLQSPKSGGDKKGSQDATVNTLCNFNLKLSGIDHLYLTAELVDVYGKTQNLGVKKLPNEKDTFNVNFTPKMTGNHILNIKYQRNHISGSPYKINVKEEQKGSADLVTASGSGIHGGRTNVPCIFKVDTSKSNGSGRLAVDIRGPSQPNIKFLSGDEVEYNVGRPGEYVLNVKFNDEHINGSPFSVRISN